MIKDYQKNKDNEGSGKSKPTKKRIDIIMKYHSNRLLNFLRPVLKQRKEKNKKCLDDTIN